MRFHAHARVIDLLVGQQLYTSANAAVRELLQNAEDACGLQQLKDSGYRPKILVRYAVSQGWVEVADNGLGMDQEAVERSFAAVGAPKTDVDHIRDLLQQNPGRGGQIAQFGIGVLSCFGVAQQIIVRTKMDSESGLAFRIEDFHEEFLELPDLPAERGTVVRLQLKPDGPMKAEQTVEAVERYVRHAAHVEIENVDANQRRPLLEKWALDKSSAGTRLIEDPAVRTGLLALDPSWDTPGSVIRAGLVVCNGGFLVSERETGLLPPQAVGYVGEIDVEPGKLTILLNREGFKRDQAWEDIGRRLAVLYNELVRAKAAAWQELLNDKPRLADTYGIDRGIIVLMYGPSASILAPDIRAQLAQMLPIAVRVKLWSEDERLPIASIVDRARARGVAFYIREGQGARSFQQGIQQGSGTVQVTEVAQTENLRATHLHAKGEVVVVSQQRNYSVEIAGQTQGVQVHEADLIGSECQRNSIRWVPVESATPEEVQLGAVSESGLLSGILGLGTELSFALLEGTNERVIRDYAGRLLNCAHPEVRELLRALPDAVGNPVRRALLQVYLDIDNYRLNEARQRVKALLLDEGLSEKAQLTTGAYTRGFLRDKLQALIDRPKEKQ